MAASPYRLLSPMMSFTRNLSLRDLLPQADGKLVAVGATTKGNIGQTMVVVRGE